MLNKLIKSAYIHLTIAQIFSLGLGFISSIIIANSLGLEKFGNFAFYFSITSIVLLFFRFGYFSSVGVLIVQTNNKKRQSEFIGAGFILAILIGLGYGLFLLLISDIIDSFFKSSIKEYILKTLPFLVFLPLTMLINQVVQALNNYRPIIIYNILSSLLSFFIILILFISNIINTKYFIFAKIIPSSIVIFTIFLLFKMRFSNLLKNLAIINLKNKKHGFHLYLGQISDQFVYQSDELIIKYFAGSSELGLYKIAQQLVNPFGMLAKNYAFSKYKILAKSSFADKTLEKNIFLISMFQLIQSIIFSFIAINYFYKNVYHSAFYIAVVLSIAIFYSSLYQLYNNFLNSHSLGKITRNISIKMSLTNLIANLLFIPHYGSIGAAFASLLAMFTYYYFCLKEYKIYSKVNNEQQSKKLAY